MRRITSVVCKGLLAAALLCFAAMAWTAENNEPVRHLPAAADDPTDRILVLWNSSAVTNKRAQLDSFAKQAGTSVSSSRQITPRIELLRLGKNSPAAAAAMLANLRADPRVRYADYDHRRFAHAVPNDPDYPYVATIAGQWYLQAVEASAIRAEAAWDTSKGRNGIVIADLDTGVRYNHPDLKRATAAGKLLPGYDFVDTDPFGGGFLQANDGNARDADPSDPGDWVSATDQQQHPQQFGGCDQGASSWHGTRTAGIIGALTDNTIGVAGINWNAYILPVRVLGKCGGFDSDILDGMRWAAGFAVIDAPVNPYPARVINMSLGGTGACNVFYQDVFAELTAAGVIVVASAGNEGGAVGTPANCPGAVAVAGLRSIGTKVGFSNLGPNVTISAPGGNCINTGQGQPCLFSIDTTTGTGSTVPTGFGYTDQTNFNVGTSFSAPMVSGVASLMMGVNQNLQPSHIIARLQAGATKPFPKNPDPGIPDCHAPGATLQTSECNCTTTTCGAGMLNAQGAMIEAVRPIASVLLPTSVSAGNTVNLAGNRSVASCGRTIATYLWSVVSGPGALSNTNLANTSIPAPPAGMTVLVHLVVTDSANATDTADITITSSSATSSVPTITPVTSCPAALVVPQIPEPTATFSANPSPINSGQSSTLTWSSTNATGCTASGAWTGAKATSGTQSTGALTSTSTFSLTCDGAGGTSSTQSATVTVTPLPTATLSASPASVMSGQSSMLTWSSTNATGCTASGTWTGAKATSGTESTGALTAASTYTLVCDGPSGTSTSHSVTVAITAITAGGGGGGGGGGALELLSLLALSLLLLTTRRPVPA